MKPVSVEMVMARIDLYLPSVLVNRMQPGERIKTAGYLREICQNVTFASYRNSIKIFNNAHRKSDDSIKLTLGTFCTDIELEGNYLKSVKSDTAKKILSEWGFDPVSGLYPVDKVFPEMLESHEHEEIIINPDNLIREADPEWNPADPDLDELIICDEEDAYSQPDMEVFQPGPRKRTRRPSIDPEDRQMIAESYFKWYNSLKDDPLCRIASEVKAEKNPSQVCYISADAVYVPKQNVSKELKERGKLEDKTVSHMNIHVEADSKKYYITSTDTDEAFAQLIAFLLNNDLYHRFMVVFIDGEIALYEKLNKYLEHWDHITILDYAHAEHKIFDRLSNAIRAERVIDPRGKTEYYVNGSKKGQIRKQDKTSLSRLYARKATQILWVGNTPGLISYLENINPKDIKNEDELRKLISYFERKAEWIPCYAMRKRLGLRNSSNAVEGQNQSLVANHQKNNGTTWSVTGSGTNALFTALFKNNEDDRWFRDRTISFSMG